jgi:hypothetical protein
VTDQDRNKAWGFALFGDDVRSEVGGKISLMGLYQSEMLFPHSAKFPIAVPKLIIQIMYYEIVGAIRGDFTFKVTYGAKQDPVAELPLQRKDIMVPPPVQPDEDLADEPQRILHLRLPIVLAPFPIAEAGRLKVRAHYEDGAILKLGSLAIKNISEADFQKAIGATASAQ